MKSNKMISVRGVSRLVLVAMCGAIVAMTVAACNTVEGAGKDIKSGGKAIEETAADAKN
jgi:predicted small secreted protein